MAGVIGWPVAHSLSPAIHNAAFAECGLDWVYVGFPVAPGAGADAVAAMRALGLGGLSVTMPHKTDVIAGVDVLSPAAQRLDAVNCLAWDGASVVGHNTDGAGFVAALEGDAGEPVAGRRFAVLGAGGAARAVVLALAEAGAADIAVVNRTPAAAARAASLAGAVGRVGDRTDVTAADVVVNATSVGMAGTTAAGELPVPADALHRDQLVVDLVYHPIETALLAAARARGAATADGVGMLVQQAAIAFRSWTGVDAPIVVMQAAARAALSS